MNICITIFHALLCTPSSRFIYNYMCLDILEVVLFLIVKSAITTFKVVIYCLHENFKCFGNTFVRYFSYRPAAKIV